MANPSRRYPFAIEVHIADKWYGTEGFRDRDTAEAMAAAHAALARKRNEKIELRVRDIREAEYPNVREWREGDPIVSERQQNPTR